MTKRERWLVVGVIVLVTISVGLLALDAWGLRLFHGSGVDYVRFGTWSDAMQAVFTTAAVVVALGAIAYDLWTRDAEERKQRDTLLTSLFHWAEALEVRERGSERLLRITWDVHVRNASGVPIYDWHLEMGDEHRCFQTHGALIPGDRIFNFPYLDDVDAASIPQPVFVFRSLDDRVWKRSARGVLETLSSPDPFACSHVTKEPVP